MTRPFSDISFLLGYCIFKNRLRRFDSFSFCSVYVMYRFFLFFVLQEVLCRWYSDRFRSSGRWSSSTYWRTWSSSPGLLRAHCRQCHSFWRGSDGRLYRHFLNVQRHRSRSFWNLDWSFRRRWLVRRGTRFSSPIVFARWLVRSVRPYISLLLSIIHLLLLILRVILILLALASGALREHVVGLGYLQWNFKSLLKNLGNVVKTYV